MWPSTLFSEWATETQNWRTGPSLLHQLAAGTWRQELWVVSFWFFYHHAALPRQLSKMLVSWWCRRRGQGGKN